MNLVQNKILTVAVITILLCSSFTTENSILGNWFSPDMEHSTIEVYKADDGLIYGKIIDCDKKEWIGETILKKVAYDEESKQWKGEIYSLVRNTSIDVTLNFHSENQLKIVGKKWFITKTFYWSKK